MAARRQVRRAVTVAAPPEAVWQALVEQDLAAQWLGMATRSQPGAGTAERLRDCDGRPWARQVVSLTRGRRLVYCWWPEHATTASAGDVSVVEIELDPDAGGTVVTVTETALADHDDDLPGGLDPAAFPAAIVAGHGAGS